jgi:hypothetical protein
MVWQMKVMSCSYVFAVIKIIAVEPEEQPIE